MKIYLLLMYFLSLQVIAQVKSPDFKTEDFPTITIKMMGNDKSITCELDPSAKIYLCPNGKHPILVRHSFMGFTAITRDKKNSPMSINLSSVKSNDKTLYEMAIYPGSGGGYGGGTEDSFEPKKTFKNEIDHKIYPVANFFDLNSYDANSKKERMKGSEDYEKIATQFIEENKELKNKLEKVQNQKNYQIELANGKKINCTRDEVRKLTPKELEYKDRFVCGSFKCDDLVVDGKKYQTNLLYDTSGMGPQVLTLFDKDGLGPKASIKKIKFDKSNIPLEDNSYFLKHPNSGISLNFPSPVDDLPASLKENSDSIALFKDPMFNMSFNFYKDICSDKEHNLAALNEAKNKLSQKIADAELIEFIQLLGNGNLVGKFIDPTKAASIGCLYDGVYLDEAATKNLDRIKKNIHPDKQVDQTISQDRANELFKKAAAMEDIAWKYKQDGCYARAHLMARRFEAEGVRVDKVWIKGDLYIPGTNPPIQWNFHVAPIVYVKNANGVIEKMVIDPSLFDKPVTVEEWDNKMSKHTIKGSVITAFPFPENAAFMERSVLSFSSSDPYLPGDDIYKSEESKMKMADDTMKMFKGWEPK
jgi:hypothetical protein